MIPKTLHYIWLGGNKTSLANKCINSFHTFMSDYDIIEWNESNIDLRWFNETELLFYNKFYESGKFAFCADLVRLHLLKRFGGIYVDADVEFIKHLPDEFLKSPFIGRSKPDNTVCNGCIWACEKDDKLVSFLIRSFSNQLTSSLNTYGTRWIFNSLLVGFFSLFGDICESKEITQFHGYTVYPSEYFCPINNKNNKLIITENTVSIHHFSLSWKG
jgi:mannosyltransferase OCH1-like enzyme